MPNTSLGPIQLADASLSAINDAFRQLTDRIDAQAGLRGRAQVFDRLGVSTPTQAGDAVNLGSAPTDLTLNSLRIIDADGNLIHSFGAIV
jgi:hypothetical protein